MTIRRVFLLCSCAASLALSGCAQTPGGPSVRLALEGPPLFIVAEGEHASFSGVMDRGCMAGAGGMILHNREKNVACQGAMDRPATDKGRLYIDLSCDNGDSILIAMRNLGPDQGMGMARINETGDLLTLFYHPCEEEAARRLEGVKKDIADAQKAQADKEKKSDE